MIVLDGMEGGTAASQEVFIEHVGIPILAAIPEAVRSLQELDMHRKVQLIVSGGIRSGADVAKALALGADAVSIGVAAVVALGDNSPEHEDGYEAIGSAAGFYDDWHEGRDPAGISTQDQELASRFDPELGGRRLANYLRAMVLEAQTLARACGKSHVHNLEPEDMVALTVEAAAMSKVPLAGTELGARAGAGGVRWIPTPREAEQRWRRSSACSTTTRRRATRPSTRATRSRRSRATPTARRTPTPEAIDFTPGDLLGCVSGALGLRQFCDDAGHELVVTSDKDGEDSELDRNLADAEVVISQPFWPAYMTAERIAKAPNLKLIVTAGIGSDHTDLAGGDRARDHGRRGHLLQLDLGLRARRDDDPRPGAQLHPDAPDRRSTAAGTSRTRSRAATTSRGCRSGPSPRAGSAPRCCGG